MRYGKRLVLAIVVILGVALAYYYGISSYVSLTTLQKYAHQLRAYVDTHYLLSIMLYIVSLMLVVIFGLPVVTLFVVAAGYLYGIVEGFIYSDFAMSIGACLAVLIYRYFLLGYLSERWGGRLQKTIAQIKAHGGSYLLSLQLASGIPFFLINSLAVIAKIPLVTVFWTSAVGSIPFLMIYLIAGSRLYTIASLNDLFTPSMMLVFVGIALLALLPLLLRKLKKHN